MSNKMERFTQRARRALSLAQEKAERLQHPHIGTEHLLLGLMREGGGVAGRVLRDFGLRPTQVEPIIERLTSGNKRPGVSRMDLSPTTKKVLELAVDEARRMGHHQIGTGHLLLGLVRHTDGVAVDVFRELNISPDEIMAVLRWRMATGNVFRELKISPDEIRRQTRGELQEYPQGESALQPGAVLPYRYRFTQRARRALSLAQEEAERMQHPHIGTEHLLLGLMREEGGVAGRALRDLGLRLTQVEQIIERLTSANQRPDASRMDLSPATKKVLELAVDEARRMGRHYIGTEHLLLGLVRHTDGVAVDVFRELKISPDEIRRQTRGELQENPQGESALQPRAALFGEKNLLRLDIEGSSEPIIIKPEAETIFGRRDPATGAMPDVDLTPFAGYQMGVSRRHAAIRFGDGQSLNLWDLGSSNGTYLNGERLSAHRPYRLHNGDELRLGSLMMRVHFLNLDSDLMRRPSIRR